jgi:hypothetical protein
MSGDTRVDRNATTIFCCGEHHLGGLQGIVSELPDPVVSRSLATCHEDAVVQVQEGFEVRSLVRSHAHSLLTHDQLRVVRAMIS